MANEERAETAGPATSSIDAHPDFRIVCGEDTYEVNKAAIASRSEYLKTICFTPEALQSKKHEFPRGEKIQVKLTMHFLKTGEYQGRLGASEAQRKMKEEEERRREEKENDEDETSVEFRSKDPSVLAVFPDFESGFVVRDTIALQVAKIITKNELFQTSKRAFYGRGFRFRCQPERLPRSIQIELYPFIAEIKTRKGDHDKSPILHAYMFNFALKYKVPDMRPVVVEAFRESVEAWSSAQGCSVIEALQVVNYQRPCMSSGAEHVEMHIAMANVIAMNWGWIKHGADFMDLVQSDAHRNVLIAAWEDIKSIQTYWTMTIQSSECEEAWEEDD